MELALACSKAALADSKFCSATLYPARAFTTAVPAESRLLCVVTEGYRYGEARTCGISQRVRECCPSLIHRDLIIRLIDDYEHITSMHKCPSMTETSTTYPLIRALNGMTWPSTCASSVFS